MDEIKDKLDAAKRRLLLHSYEQQLTNGRRLARYRMRMRLAQGLEPADPDPEIRRQKFSNDIAQELFESLLFYPNSNPVIEQIREELSQELGKEIQFTYPHGKTLQMAVRENDKLRKLTEEEQNKARALLHKLTKEKVDGNLIREYNQIERFRNEIV